MKKLWYLMYLSLLCAITCLQGIVHAAPGYYPRGVYPDFSKYKIINIRNGLHFQPAFPGSTAVFWFKTPDEVRCTANEYVGVTCTQIPGTPYKTINGQPSAGEFLVFIGPYSYKVRASGQPVHPPERRLEGYAMVPGTKFTLGDTTCAVGVNHLLSCKEGSHGFVLQTSGDSWVI